jgi:membrane protein CcdC involved in cytochrome C biogenesis
MADLAENGQASEGRPLTGSLRRLLQVFALLAFMAGVLLFVLSEDTDRFFSWTIEPPLTAAFLGASYWAAFVLILWSARQHDWARARPALPPVLAIAVLLLVATLIHRDRFDFDTIFGWFWLAAYTLVPPIVVALLLQQLRVPGSDVRGCDLPLGLRPALAIQSAVMLLVGAALFIAPQDADSVLPWSLTPLTGRAVGAFIFGFGVAAAHASIEDDLDRFRGAALAYLVLGGLQLVAVARYSGDLDGEGGGDLIYLAFLVGVVAVALYALLAAPRAGPERAASSASSLS